MKLIILRQNSIDFFKKACKLESSLPKGQWRYFKFESKEEVLGLYENSNEGINLHPDFFKYFLGQFTPTLNDHILISQFKNFTDFCLYLNDLLHKNVKIFDLSVSSFWIWTNEEKNILVPKKLKNYLNFNN